MLGSLGMIAAALIIMYTGWTLADPIIGAGIGLFIVPRTWKLLYQTVHILMEGVPAEIDLHSLSKGVAGNPRCHRMHYLHVWTITSGTDPLAGHVVVTDMKDARSVLRNAKAVLEEKFKIDHVTIQVEDAEMRAAEPILRI